jgi:GntR family transcriptional regulator
MLIRVDTHSGVPVFRQIMDQIRFHIASALLKPGDEIPSTRTLSSELGINPMTVSKAYGLLEEEGLLERRPGLPLVVRMIPKPELETERVEQLRALLSPTVTAVRQLGIAPERAVAVFRKLLNGSDEGNDA